VDLVREAKCGEFAIIRGPGKWFADKKSAKK
jgi:hypothetical protein